MIETIQSKLATLREEPKIHFLLNDVVSVGHSMILGGAVRDWFFGNEPKDVDVVVNCPAYRLSILNDYKPTRNKFGGYKFSLGGTEFDIWSLEHSWALMNDKGFDHDINVVTQAVFFNMDAIGYRLNSDELVDNGFKAALASKVMDIVYEPNPFPFFQVSKALIMAKRYDMTASKRLRDYIDGQIGRGYNKLSFTRYQNANYGSVNYDYDECMQLCSR